jgi:hypothetical protein
MADHTLAFADVELLARVQAIDMVFWAEEAQKYGNCLTRLNLHDITIIVDSIPIMTIIIKLWTISREDWCLTTALLGGMDTLIAI